MEKVKLIEQDFKIDGMSCASCVGRVEKALTKVEGVHRASVNLATELARVQIDSLSRVPSLQEAIRKAGYQSEWIQSPLPPAAAAKSSDAEGFKLLIGLCLSLPLALPMFFAPFGIDLMPPAFLQLALASPLQFWLGWRFYREAWRAIRARSANMEVLVALGTSAAYGLSVYQLLLHPGMSHLDHSETPLYFESSALVIVLVLLGKYLEKRAKHKTNEAIAALQALRPELALVRYPDGERWVAIQEVKPGDMVVVKAGETIPVDGLILEGLCHSNEAMITGESEPQSKGPGDAVTGGSLNLDGLILVETKAKLGESTLARIIRLVENAQAEKAPIQHLVDRVSAIFVPVVLGLALLTLLSWYFYGQQWEPAILHSIAVLVIACPCALGLATPTAIIVGTGLAAKHGILIRDGAALESVHSLTMVAFDKTGTLTHGRPQLVSLISFHQDFAQNLQLCASLQAASNHPMAHAVLSRAKEEGLSWENAEAVRTLAGRGISGNIGQQSYSLGSLRLMQEKGLMDAATEALALQQAQQGSSLAFLADHSRVLAMLVLQDQLKPNALASIKALHRLGLKTALITGDHAASAHIVSEALGIPSVYADVLPEDKARLIRQWRDQGEKIAMVGDGINDAPALASADVGIAMSTGTDIAMHSAGITLMRGDPSLIADALAISRQTYRKIQQNLFWAFLYNALGIPLAAFGLLSPVVAGAAMAFSSVSVVVNALLLRRRYSLKLATKQREN